MSKFSTLLARRARISDRGSSFPLCGGDGAAGASFSFEVLPAALLTSVVVGRDEAVDEFVGVAVDEIDASTWDASMRSTSRRESGAAVACCKLEGGCGYGDNDMPGASRVVPSLQFDVGVEAETLVGEVIRAAAKSMAKSTIIRSALSTAADFEPLVADTTCCW